MKVIKKLMVCAAMMITVTAVVPAMAQESSYKLGTVWEVGRIKVLPGQAENYLDWLATTWKRNQEAMKAEGMVVSYHVLSTNNRRGEEPDLLLVIEYKDYQTTAQSEAMRKKINALMGLDNRSGAAAAGKREAMRVQLGSTEYQELILK